MIDGVVHPLCTLTKFISVFSHISSVILFFATVKAEHFCGGLFSVTYFRDLKFNHTMSHGVQSAFFHLENWFTEIFAQPNR